MDFAVLMLAMISPFLYAACNHFDNILLSKYFKEGGVGTLMLFSALLSVLALPVLIYYDSTVLDVPWEDRLLLALVGFINVVLLWAYLQAIFGDDPTDVVIYYQVVPVLGLGMGYLALGETITILQFVGMLLVIAGALYLTVIQDGDGGYRLRWRTAGYMSIAVFCWALESTLFKVVAIEENPVRSFFWEHVALVVFGVMLFIAVSRYRRTFLKALRLNSVPILGLNILNEGAYMLANFVAAVVIVLAPVSLTLLVTNSFQPIFVLGIGYAFLTLARSRVLKKLAIPSWRVARQRPWAKKIGYGTAKSLFAAHRLFAEVDHVNTSNMRQKLIVIVLTGIGVMLIGNWE